jgi:hypothetical protein
MGRYSTFIKILNEDFSGKLNPEKIKEFRKDFLMLMSNVKNLNDYDSVREWSKSVNLWRDRFDEYLYKKFLPQLDTEIRNKYPNDVIWIEKWDKKIREMSWPFIVSLISTIQAPDNYRTKEQLYSSFKNYLPKWESKIKREARKTWAVLDEFYKYYQEKYNAEMDVRGVEEYKMNIAGHEVIFKYEKGNQSKADTYKNVIHNGIEKSNQLVSERFPVLFEKKLPIVIDFFPSRMISGEYEYDHVTITPFALMSTYEFIRTLIHENAHHLYEMLSQKNKDRWAEYIKSIFKYVDVKDIIKELESINYKQSEFFTLDEKLKETKPELVYKLKALENSKFPSLREANTLEDLKAWADGKDNTYVSVIERPITDYANTNDMEAFAEAVSVLVTKGERFLHPETVKVLKEIS